MTVVAAVTVHVDAATYALWAPEPFVGIESFDEWAVELGAEEALARHVEAGHVVPFAVEGVPAEVVVRFGTSPGPHVLVSAGVVRLSNLESVGGVLWDSTIELAVPAGRYTVAVHRDDSVELVLTPVE